MDIGGSYGVDRRPNGMEKRLGRRLRVRDLYILSVVVNAGSMAKAARELAMSQPSVSEAIANLEHLLGVRACRPQHPRCYGDDVCRRDLEAKRHGL